MNRLQARRRRQGHKPHQAAMQVGYERKAKYQKAEKLLRGPLKKGRSARRIAMILTSIGKHLWHGEKPNRDAERVLRMIG